MNSQARRFPKIGCQSSTFQEARINSNLIRTILNRALLLGLLLPAGIGWAQDADRSQDGSAHRLDTMVVTADRVPEQLQGVSQHVTVFSQKDIERSGAETVADLLKSAGIQVYHDGAESYGNEGVVIRGGRSSMHGFDIAGDILVLVDGHRSGSDFLSMLDLNATERIEVIRGPGAVQYGAAAMGGVINVITKRGKQKPAAAIEAGFGSWEAQRYKAAASGQSGSFDFSVFADYFTRNDYKLGNGDNFENSDLGSRTRYTLNTGYNFNPNNRLGIILQGSQIDDAGKGEDASSRYYYYTRQNRDNYSADISYEGSSPSKATTWLARYFQGEVNYDLSRFTKTSDTQLPLSENENRYRGGQAQIGHEFEMARIVGGVDWMAYDFDQSQTGAAASASTQNRAVSDYDSWGAFLIGKLYLLENRNLVISGGLRYDLYDIAVDAEKIKEGLTVFRDIDQDNWTPSIGIAYSPLDLIKLRANYAQAFKMPLPRQLTGYTVMMSTPFIGNPDLKPEKSDNWDAGFDIDYNSFVFSGTFFYSQYEDLIGYETHNVGDSHYSAGKHYWYYNVDEATINGIEIGGRFDVGAYYGLDYTLEPYVSWTHLFEFEDGNGDKLENRSRDSLAFGIVFDSRKIGLIAGLDATYYGDQYTSDNEKLEEVGDATVVDLHLSQRIWKIEDFGEVRLKLKIRNLFDEYYSTNEDSWSPGRSFYFGLAYQY